MTDEREVQIRKFVNDIRGLTPDVLTRFAMDAGRDLVVLGDMAKELLEEHDRLREQLRIAEGALGQIASDGCPTCPPQTSSLAESRAMADRALKRIVEVE